MSKFDPQSRFSLVEVAQIAPGVDFITKSSIGPFVDTKVSLNKFDEIFAEANMARVYLAVATVKEMAEGAGVLDELRTEMLTVEAKGYQLGYADAMKENLGGTLSDLVERLGVLSSHLDGGDNSLPVPEAGGIGGEEPLVLITDGESRPRAGEGADAAATPVSEPARQGNSSRGKRRPASISVSASNGNPFRL